MEQQPRRFRIPEPIKALGTAALLEVLAIGVTYGTLNAIEHGGGRGGIVGILFPAMGAVALSLGAGNQWEAFHEERAKTQSEQARL